MMSNDYIRDYLMHHGIQGQKWGQQNGPPYPLDGNDYSSSEKAAAKEGGGSSAKVVLAKLKANREERQDKRYAKRLEKATREADKAEKEAEIAKEKARASNAGKITKEAVITSGNAQLVKQYARYLTNSEMQDALNRINNEQKVSEIAAEQTAAGKRASEGVLKTIGKVAATSAVGAVLTAAVNTQFGNSEDKSFGEEFGKAFVKNAQGQVNAAMNNKKK